MGQTRNEEKSEDGCPECSHAKTKVWFRDSRSSNVQTQTFIDNAPRCSISASEGLASREYISSSSKWPDTEVARCYRTDLAVEQSDHEDSDTRSCPNPHQYARCQRCDVRSSGSRPPSAHQEKKIYLHLNLKNRESPQLVVCPERNHSQHHSASREGCRDTVIDVDSISLPLPSRPMSRSLSRLSEPSLSMSSYNTPRGGHRTPRDSFHELQSLRQAYGSGSTRSSVEGLPSPAASTSQFQFKAQVQNVDWQLTPRAMATARATDELATPRASGRHLSQVPHAVEKVVASDGYVDETLLPLPKSPHGQQQIMCVGSSQNTPRVGPDLGAFVKVASARRSMKVRRDPMRVKGGSDTPPSEEKEDVHESVDTDQQKEGVVLSWENLTVTSKVGKTLLDNLNGQIVSGFTAIMGPSGSGKSTLLNTLACRMGQSASITGRILLNGGEYKIADLKKMSGYVMQDDLLNAHLTVEETLKYTTRLKLEPSLTEDEVNTRVDEIIKQMGLDHVRNTVIGSPEKRGISGGERKRVCVGMELLTHPQLLFLDEPTSGLDSVTALSLCEQLQNLAAIGKSCTIVCTIHQPQAKIFNLFHYLIILKAGQVIYQGKASEVLHFFEESGFPCPEYTNPADHLLDVITPSINRPRDSLRYVDDVLKSKFHSLPVNMSQGSQYLILQTTRERMPWHRQYVVLLNRGIREQIRKKNVLITQLCQSVLMAILIGGVFFQIGDTQKSTVRRQPVLFFCVINQGVFGALTVINSFPGERALTLRERAAGMYYCSSYFMAKLRWFRRSFRPSFSRALFTGWLASREMVLSL
ncbi:hypothetical protein M758_10G178300 [Ceratodon purpureus]|nr:hypothetical protein M758_10G178300 [Ceratodon purpureus]